MLNVGAPHVYVRGCDFPFLPLGRDVVWILPVLWFSYKRTIYGVPGRMRSYGVLGSHLER